MKPPVVSVICLSFNHATYLREAVESVLHQTYPFIEVIIVDDASSDHSADIARQLQHEYPQVKTLLLRENVGYCKAFNRGLEVATGEYSIDLAADDMLLPHRIEVGLQAFAIASEKMGVHFSDAELMDAKGHHLSYHSDRFPHVSIPQGNIYKNLIARYFICSPTLMFKREVLDALNGYDESLHYEDFDILIRSSRLYEYQYSPEVLVKKRILKNSLVANQFSMGSPHQQSTYRICEKILQLNQNETEKRALQQRILYELRVNFRLLNWGLSWKYLLLLFRNSKSSYP